MSGFSIKTAMGVAACKAARAGLRIARSGGTTLPGRAAMFFDKDILASVSEGMDIIVVTGTNGKTTTCRMLEQALSSTGRSVLANKSGANLLRGVTAEFTANADWMGRPRKKFAVIECDEGALKQVVPLIKPKVILVTNLFRDQLDRYGEVMHTLDQIRTGIRLAPQSIICLNADCSLTSSLAFDVPNKVIYYGLDCPVGEQKDAEISDAKYCIRCGTEYKYEYHTYAHLGGFYCPKCGYRRSRPQTAVTAIRKLTAQGTDIQMEFRSPDEKDPAKEKTVTRDVFVSLPAVYNVYNAAGAVCAYTAAGFGRGDILKSLAKTSSSFGRMETFDLDGVRVQMILVKNPAGCNQALSYVTSLEEDYNAVICLNDQTADGHDISWIWDAEYEKLSSDENLKNIIVAGDRAEDMQLRLKYAGVPEDKIRLVRGWDQLTEQMRDSSYPVFVLPNYTSMLALRRTLAEATGKQEFWKG